VFSSAEFLVATYNSRGAGRSGGRGGASASTDTADYESVLERLLSYAQKVSVPVNKVYICVCVSYCIADYRDTVWHSLLYANA